MSLLTLLKPSNQNNTQRIGFALSLISMVGIIVAHYPFDGYTIKIYAPQTCGKLQKDGCTSEELGKLGGLEEFFERVMVTDMSGSSSDSINSASGGLVHVPKAWDDWSAKERQAFALSNIFPETADQVKQLRDKCVREVCSSNDKMLDFSQWTSNGPLIGWLGSIMHFLVTIGGLGAVTLIWLYVFASPKLDRKLSDPE